MPLWQVSPACRASSSFATAPTPIKRRVARDQPPVTQPHAGDCAACALQRRDLGIHLDRDALGAMVGLEEFRQDRAGDPRQNAAFALDRR